MLPDGDSREVRVATGSHTCAEVSTLRAALEEIASIEDRDVSQPAVLCADSRAALALLPNGPATKKKTLVAANTWSLLRPVAETGKPIYMQRVPSHCGLPGNERVDSSREASALPQDSTPIDVETAQEVFARATTSIWRQGLMEP